MVRAVVIFSGGVDSTAAALWAMDQQYEEIELLTYRFSDERRQYGEIALSINVAKHLNISHTIIDISIPVPAFPTTNQPFCQHVERKSFPGEEIAVHGVFPLNVAILLLSGASYAALRGSTHVIWGAIKEESKITADFTGEYSEVITSLINKSKTIKQEMKVFAPLVNESKTVAAANLSLHSGLFECTWSCKNSINATHCGECYGCEGRRMAAVLANIKDKTTYKKTFFAHPFSAEQITSFTDGSADAQLQRDFASFMLGSGKESTK